MGGFSIRMWGLEFRVYGLVVVVVMVMMAVVVVLVSAFYACNFCVYIGRVCM